MEKKSNAGQTCVQDDNGDQGKNFIYCFILNEFTDCKYKHIQQTDRAINENNEKMIFRNTQREREFIQPN